MLGFMDLGWPRVCLRSTSVLSLIKAVVVSFKCHWICLQCAIDNMSISFNIMAWSCAGAESETMLPMFCDPIHGVR